MNNILIIGANGLIGKSLVSLSESIPGQVFTADVAGDADLIVKGTNDINDISTFIAKNGVSVVVNLAAISSDKRCQESPHLVDATNIEFPCRLLESLITRNEKILFIHTSTEWIYGDLARVESPIPPDHISLTGLGLYASSKLRSEQELCKIASVNHRVLILRLGIVYSVFNKDCNSFVNKALEAASSCIPFTCNSGLSARRYVSMDQVCATFIAAMSNSVQQRLQIFNVQGPRLITNLRVLELVKSYKSDFEFHVSENVSPPSIRDVNDSRVLPGLSEYNLDEQIKLFFGGEC